MPVICMDPRSVAAKKSLTIIIVTASILIIAEIDAATYPKRAEIKAALIGKAALLKKGRNTCPLGGQVLFCLA